MMNTNNLIKKRWVKISRPGVRFSKLPKLFGPISGAIIFLHILKTKAFPGLKFCNKFALSYLEIIAVKDQLLE